MVFTSPTFLVFLALVLCVYWALPGRRAQNLALLLSSLTFYAWGEPVFVGLILVCAATGYGCGIAIETRRELGRQFLAAGCAVAIGILFAFKYFNFFVAGGASLANALGFSLQPTTLSVLLPIGISFFTFQTVGYMVDVYRGSVRAERDPVDFFLFVTFFPQLVAGPIERAGNLLSQIKEPRTANGSDLRWGIGTALRGFVKKVVVADNLAPIVNQLFSHETLSGPLVLVACTAFAFQIYCDFSGYTDIARGVARCMGFRLTANFKRPYLSKSPTEFWRRWHITLSTWFRDYVYIPLGGSQSGPRRVAINLAATFVLSGLWHGASLNFVLWGAFHGLAVVLHKQWSKGSWSTRLQRERVYPTIAWSVNFALILYGWMLFRVTDVTAIVSFSQALFSDFAHIEVALLVAVRILPFIALTALVDFMESRAEQEREASAGWSGWLPQPAVVGLLLVLVVFAADGGGDFIYFKF